MALELGPLKSNNGNFNGGGRRFNIAIELTRYDVKDSKKAHPGEDAVYGMLRHKLEGGGFPEYTEHEEAPTTELRVVLEKKEVKGENAPLVIWDLRRGKDNTKACDPGAILVFENASFDQKTNTVYARWMKVITNGPEGELDRALTNEMTMVMKEAVSTENGETRYRQTRYVAYTDDAVAFSSKEAFREAAIALLTPNVEAGGDRPGIWVRIINLNNPFGENQLVSTTLSLGFKSATETEAARMLTPEETVEKFFTDTHFEGWVDNINLAGTPDAEGYLFEIIPHFRWNTGKKSRPSGGGRDDSVHFQYPVSADSNTMLTGFAAAHTSIKRKEVRDDDGKPAGLSGWFSAGTIRTSRFSPLYTREELVTPNLPAELAEKFKERALKRNSDAFDRIRNKGKNKEAEDNEDLAFGEPDHSSQGLTPR